MLPFPAGTFSKEHQVQVCHRRADLVSKVGMVWGRPPSSTDGGAPDSNPQILGWRITSQCLYLLGHARLFDAQS